MLIAFEGGEGTGKGVQIKLLKNMLEKRGFKVKSITEPGGSPECDAIRDVLLNRKQLKFLGLTEALLFSASRAQQIRTVTIPALNEGFIILSDRSLYSMIPYMSYGRGVPEGLLNKLNDIAVEDTRPDLVILLDLPPKLGVSRKKKQKELNRMDLESIEFYRKVRKGYLKLAKDNPKKWRIINASDSVDNIHRKVVRIIMEILR
jgi:dTMP kinase